MPDTNGGWIMPFHLFAATRRHAKRRQDEKTPCERLKYEKTSAMRKDEITPNERTKTAMRKGEISAQKDIKKKTFE